MTTTNIFFILLAVPTEESAQRAARRAAEKRDAEMAATAAAQMEAGYKASVELIGTHPLFLDGYWICDQGHQFARGQVHSPRHCSVCESKIFRWIPGPGFSEYKPDIILAKMREPSTGGNSQTFRD